MAQVTLQAVVNFEQVNKLDKWINETNGKKIVIDTTSYNKAVKEAERATQELLKTQKAQAQANEAAAKADKARVSVTTEQIKAQKELVRVEIEQERKRKTELQTDQQAIKNRRETVKLEREEAKAQGEANKAGKEHNETVKKQGLLYDILGRSVSSFLARMVAYRAVYAGIRAITNGFKEALQTLKAVDDELVTVRKVTGFDQWQMAGVEEQAYAVASKYGTSAADYTSGVAAFARAGYKDLSGDLAELAEKTKIVGDTTADVAQQFLLSVDAAYKYEGNIERLTAVLDGANEIDNKYATSIEKIAEGMGIVAPVAAQMHVGIDELAASIGTITAVTQRTGTEAARALRAIFLNIVGDTKTEIDEGVTWTTGEIEGLRDVIKLYAKDAWEAAQASGGIIDPMKAIEGLSKSIKDGVLTEAQLMEMVSDIGGKLRTSQLLAIVNNWDMYESMLETYRNAYGSADKEIENAMDSWSRKTEVLKNKWTEFVKTGLNSNAFKGALDILTGFIERLGTLPGVLTRIAMIVAGFNMERLSETLGSAKEKLTGLVTALKTGTMSAGTFGTALGIVGIALSAVVFAVQSYQKAQEDARQATVDAIEETKTDISNLDQLRDRYESIINSTADEATKDKELAKFKQELIDAYGFEKEAVEKVNKERQTGLDLLDKEAEASLRRTLSENQSTFETAKRKYQGERRIVNAVDASGVSGSMADIEAAGGAFTDGGDGMTYLTVRGENLRQTYENLAKVIEVLEKKQLSRNGITEDEEFLLDSLRAQYADLGNEMDKWGSIYEGQIDLMARYNLMVAGVTEESVKSQKDLAALKQTLNETYGSDSEVWAAMEKLLDEMFPSFEQAVEASTQTVENETDALFANQKALDENATASERAAAAKKDAEAAAAKFCDALFDENGELTANAKAVLVASDYLADLTKAELDARLEAARANYASLRAQLAGVSTEALKAAYAMIAYQEAAQDGQLDPEAWKARRTGGYAYRLMSQIAALEREINSISVQATAVSSYGSSSGSSGRSSGGGSGSGHSGSSHSGSGSSSSSTTDARLNSLKDRVSLLKSELSLMKERGDSEEDQISKIREIQDALKNEYQYLESIKGDQTTINNLYQEWYSYANQISDLEKQAADEAQRQADAIQAAVEAQKALDNILKNRSVRVYNAATGQWEWQSDPAAVASAQAELNSAISNAGYSQDAWALLYSALSGVASIKDNWLNAGPGAVSNAFGGNSYGNTYNFGKIQLTEAQAESMTVKQFVDLANALPAFNNSP